MGRKLERSEVRTLLIAAVGLVVSVWSVWTAAHVPATPELQHAVAALCPHWTEC